jgi:hypothetical protein
MKILLYIAFATLSVILLTYILMGVSWAIVKNFGSAYLLSWGMTHNGLLFIIFLPACFIAAVALTVLLLRVFDDDG